MTVRPFADRATAASPSPTSRTGRGDSSSGSSSSGGGGGGGGAAVAGSTHTARSVCASLLSLSCAAPRISRGSRLLLGCSFFCLSGLSVLLGIGYALWVPAAVVALLIVGEGSGSPAGGGAPLLLARDRDRDRDQPGEVGGWVML